MFGWQNQGAQPFSPYLTWRINMSRTATRMTAKSKSVCPKCDVLIFRGDVIKVYKNKWYHEVCWRELWDMVAAEKDLNKSILEDMEKWEDIPPVLVSNDDNQLELNMKKEVDKYEASFNAISDAINEIADLEGVLMKQRLQLKKTILNLKEKWKIK